MGNIYEYLNSKRILNYEEYLHNALVDSYHGKNTKSRLSERNALIGLIIQRKLVSIEDANINEINNEQVQRLAEMGPLDDFWTLDHFPLLEFYFGLEKAVLVKHAWDSFPDLMYQTSYYRRSFRSKRYTEAHILNQLKFINHCINFNKYDLDLKEYIIRGNGLGSFGFGHLIAASIDRNDQDITNLCLDIVYGRHEEGKVNQMIIKGMLLSHNETCWQAVRDLLISAQRQEGLRQTILECLDETSLGAMKFMIKVIIEYKLTRFASVVRAINTWAGLDWSGEKEANVRRFLMLADGFLSDPTTIDAGAKSKDYAEVYMALWAQAVFDVHETPRLLDPLLEGGYNEKAMLLFFVEQTNVDQLEEKYCKALIYDENDAIACYASNILSKCDGIKALPKEARLEMFDRLLPRVKQLPKKKTTAQKSAFSWINMDYSQSEYWNLLTSLIDYNETDELQKIMPLYDVMGINHRYHMVSQVLSDYNPYGEQKVHEPNSLSPILRDFALLGITDRDEGIWKRSSIALSTAVIKEEEILLFEKQLRRKSDNYRKEILKLIQKNDINAVKASCLRLLEAKNAEQRMAGLSLLSWMKKELPEQIDFVEEQTEVYSNRKKISSREDLVLSGLKASVHKEVEYCKENGFGLYNPEAVISQVSLDLEIINDESLTDPEINYGLSKPIDEVRKCINQLGELFKQHFDHEYSITYFDGSKESVLLGNTFARIDQNLKSDDLEETFLNHPLPEVWRKWYIESELTPLDLKLILLNDDLIKNDIEHDKTLFLIGKGHDSWIFNPKIPKLSQSHFSNPIKDIIDVLSNRYRFEKPIELISNFVKIIYKHLDPDTLFKLKEFATKWSSTYIGWRELDYIKTLWRKYIHLSKIMTDEQFKCFWNLSYWTYLHVADGMKSEYIPKYEHFIRAHELGLINDNTLMWITLTPKNIAKITTLKKEQYHEDLVKEHPFLLPYRTRAIARILEVELKRGDEATNVTHLAQTIKACQGIKYLSEILKALGKEKLVRGYIYSYSRRNAGITDIMSKLLKACYPAETDTQQGFNQAMKALKITEERLCEIACYAQQWVPFIAKYLKWEILPSAVWWLYAHMNIRHEKTIEAEVPKYSSVPLEDFSEGAVDVNWFMEVYKKLGKSKWEMLYDAAKYITSGNGHTRAKLFSDVILKKVKIKEITQKVVEKRNQDYVRVYGLVPLSKANPQGDLLKRYKQLMTFKKESKQFGSQRQTSEGLAVRIALENLSRTAGFEDPIRLQWAMEAFEAKEILEKAEALSVEDCTIELKVDEHGKSALHVTRKGKKLKSVPAKFSKHKEVAKLKAFHKILKDQYSRTRKSLETAMVNGDCFSAQEMETLFMHPVVAPMLGKLALISDHNIGFYRNGQLVSPDQEVNPIGEEVRIAHCVDMHQAKVWSQYQKHCFEQQLVQPFKQIFRELYIPTADELAEGTTSRRYAGHQIQVNKAMALLKSQQWIISYESGIQNVSRKNNCLAEIFQYFDYYTPADVEAPSLEVVTFHHRISHKTIPIDQVEAKFFSETMRDLDLVVSVAHVGDVDPEASQSSIELRQVIIEETCRLFKLHNVEITGNHAKVKGKYGEYSIHIGSGIVHMMGKAALSIIPVHSQQRGRMFLPYMDEDPKTAEIMSKVLLLAKDDKIQDPTVLDQICSLA